MAFSGGHLCCVSGAVCLWGVSSLRVPHLDHHHGNLEFTPPVGPRLTQFLIIGAPSWRVYLGCVYV